MLAPVPSSTPPARERALARPAAAAILLVVLGGCAARGPAGGATSRPSSMPSAPETASSTVAVSPHGRSPHGAHARGFTLPRRVVDAKHGGVVDPEAFYTDLLSTRAVYVAEVHDNPHDHAAQLSVIAGIFARDPSVGVGLEMVKRPFQPVLDAYVKGEIDEDALEAGTEWEDRWGFDFQIYRPIFEFARAHHIPLFALNAPDEITDKVGKGGLDALTPEERASLPELDLSNEAHKAIVREAFEAHHAHSGSFDDFYTAQVIWDETMGYEVARALNAAGGPKRMVVLAGDGHVRHGYGIPSRAGRRGIEPHRIIIPTMADELEADMADGGCDYFWVMAVKEDDLPPASPVTAQQSWASGDAR